MTVELLILACFKARVLGWGDHVFYRVFKVSCDPVNWTALVKKHCQRLIINHGPSSMSTSGITPAINFFSCVIIVQLNSRGQCICLKFELMTLIDDLQSNLKDGIRKFWK